MIIESLDPADRVAPRKKAAASKDWRPEIEALLEVVKEINQHFRIVQDPRRYTTRMLYLVANGFGYLIRGITWDAADHDPELTEIMNSFRFIGEPEVHASKP